MEPENSLLALLSDGQWHSGTSLAEALGVSRTAVWKKLNRLRDNGIEVERARGRGYRLAPTVDLLQSSSIRSALPAAVSEQIQLSVVDSVHSTNQALMDLGPDSGGKQPQLLIANQQTAGRGRRGRQWASPQGRNIYMSLAQHLSCGFSGLEGLSLVVGLAVLRALADSGAVGLCLKWPNDLLIGSQKLAGILIELQGEIEGGVRVIIGIGVNVHMRPGDSNIDQPWTSLAESHPEKRWERNRIVAAITSRVLDYVRQFEAHGFPPFREEWDRYDAYRGKEVATVPELHEGTGIGVSEVGGYLIDTGNSLEEVTAGELSVRQL